MSTTVETIHSDHLERDHAKMARQLRRVHQDLEHFVRALSHDMNANFMLLESSCRRLKNSLGDTATEAQTEHLAHIDACLAQTKRFLNDMIHLAKTGAVEMEPERVEMAAVVDEVLFEQDELLRGKGIRVDICRPLPAVWYNRQRLKQIVTNLVRNAMRHGCDSECPRIEIRAIKDSNSSGDDDLYPTVQLRVRDNGAGIDPRFAEEVFLPGKRLPNCAEEGTGMGLAIVKKIAEHYGGAAWIDYDHPEGTTIAISIPGGFSVPRPESWVSHRKDHAQISAPHTSPRRSRRHEIQHGPH
jgi:light-regulated signal transduction histidine kinase (bacteriophytochrome)